MLLKIMYGSLIGYFIILGLSDPEDEEIKIPGNATNYLPSDRG
jgi:hypothetical protein